MKRRGCVALVCLAALPAAADPIGKWRVSDGSAQIAIHPCGTDLCGSIAATAEGGVDARNPDPAKRDRPLLGLPILTLRREGDNLWSGVVYNARDGQNYAARLWMRGNSLLSIEGCAPDGALCGEDRWTRVR